MGNRGQKQNLNPEREAIKLSQVLKTVLGQDRFPINIKQTAIEYSQQISKEDPITDVKGDNLPGYEGSLHSNKVRNKWLIIYNSNIISQGRINFTLAHELGHYLLHRRKQTKFLCNQDDLLAWRSGELEREKEANTFASFLLMPIDDYRGQISGQTICLDLFKHCADRYDVSLTASILKWLDFTNERAFLVASRDGFMKWAKVSESAYKSGVFYKTRSETIPLPDDCLTLANSSHQNQLVELPSGIWGENEESKEALITLDRYDLTLTLVLLPKDPPVRNSYADDDEDNLESRKLEESYIPRFKK